MGSVKKALVALNGRPRPQSGRDGRYRAQESLTDSGFVFCFETASLVTQDGLALTHYVAEDDPGLSASIWECSDYRHVRPHPVDEGSEGAEPGASYLLQQHSTHWAASQLPSLWRSERGQKT